MKELLVLDAKDYADDDAVLERSAVRVIIRKDNTLLMVAERNGKELKLPGGGIEEGEGHKAALIREVREETGTDVIEDSLIPFGKAIEKRRSLYEENTIFYQYSYYYLVGIDEATSEPSYSGYEIELGFHPVWIDIDEAISINGEIRNKQDEHYWNAREYMILKLIREELFEK